jgi:hypothetical protein
MEKVRITNFLFGTFWTGLGAFIFSKGYLRVKFVNGSQVHIPPQKSLLDKYANVQSSIEKKRNIIQTVDNARGFDAIDRFAMQGR